MSARSDSADAPPEERCEASAAVARLREAWSVGRWSKGLRLLDVEANAYASSFASYLVTCERPDGSRVRLFCKHGGGEAYDTGGHKGGVVYETLVYRRVLRRSGLRVPRFVGSLSGGDGRRYLFLESLDGAARWTQTLDPEQVGMRLAQWIGSFHAEQATRVRGTLLRFLRARGGDYYAEWVTRTRRRMDDRERPPWLEPLLLAAPRVARILLDAPATVIHGELFPQNVLVLPTAGDAAGEVVVVDWESAAVGPGELDLAAFTDHWPPECASVWEREYVAARWRGSPPPPAFGRTLDAARFFHQLRWIGEAPGRRASAIDWRLDALKLAGERLGLL